MIKFVNSFLFTYFENNFKKIINITYHANFWIKIHTGSVYLNSNFLNHLAAIT